VAVSVLVNRRKNFIDKWSDLSVIRAANKVSEICGIEGNWDWWPFAIHQELATISFGNAVPTEFLFSYVAVAICVHLIENIECRLIQLVISECLTLDGALMVDVLFKHFFYLLKAPSSTAITIPTHKDFVNHLVYQHFVFGWKKSLEVHRVEAGFRLDASEGDLTRANVVLLFLVNNVLQEFFFSYYAVWIWVHFIEFDTSHYQHSFRAWSQLAFMSCLVI